MPGCRFKSQTRNGLNRDVSGSPKNNLKAIYLIGEDPVLSEPDMNHTIQALNNLEFLVVQDIFLTETAKLAHVVLPAAGFAADEGTFTNTESVSRGLEKQCLRRVNPNRIGR